MAKGAPDYTRITEIKGMSPTATLVTIAVDADGQLYAVVKGQYGTTLLPIAVDSAGQIIMVPRGQSGNYLNVDASGFMTSVMKGVDGVTLRTVAVDSNGKILGVLQGDYAGTLKTLAVDSQGRMLAVLTDPEDVFGNPNYMGAAELAVRLGSIDSFERRGNVLFMDDFQAGVGKWANDSAGAGGTLDLTTASPQVGRFAARVVSSATSTYYTNMAHVEPFPSLSKFGIEAAVHLEGVEDYIRLGILLFDGTDRWGFYLEVDPVDKMMRYLNSTGGWTDIQALPSLSTHGTIYHRLKLVADLVNKKYVRVIVNNDVISLSGIAGHQSASGEEEHVLINLSMAALDATQRTIRWGYAIVTQNEPA